MFDFGFTNQFPIRILSLSQTLNSITLPNKTPHWLVYSVFWPSYSCCRHAFHKARVSVSDPFRFPSTWSNKYQIGAILEKSKPGSIYIISSMGSVIRKGKKKSLCVYSGSNFLFLVLIHKIGKRKPFLAFCWNLLNILSSNLGGFSQERKRKVYGPCCIYPAIWEKYVQEY